MIHNMKLFVVKITFNYFYFFLNVNSKNSYVYLICIYTVLNIFSLNLLKHYESKAQLIQTHLI